MAKEKLHHILEAQQFSRQWLEEEFFPETNYFRKLIDLKVKPLPQFLKNKTVCLLFYEPSTRTRVSFGQAAGTLGAHVESTENAKEFSSAIKGETLIDTIRTVSSFHFDAIILRSHITGGAKEAASVTDTPIINAGDGKGQHPTQALLDIYTAREHFSTVDGLRVAMVGDLGGRTVRSLSYLLGKFKDIRIDFVSPRNMKMGEDVLAYLERHDIIYKEHNRLSTVAKEADVIYMTRAQMERMGKKVKVDGSGVSINEKIMEKIRTNSIIMHPLPRSNDFAELPEQFTQDPRVVIFRQTENGFISRMALLKMLLW